MRGNPPDAASTPSPAEDAPRPDLRAQRGALSRGRVLRRAVDIASTDGLDSLSYGRLSADTGLSKAGVQTLFASKETLQVATLATARKMFIEAVVRPAQDAAPGLARFRSLIEHWIGYVEAPLFEGGCYRVANSADQDDKPGPLRDALLQDQRDWAASLGEALADAVRSGELPDLDVDLAVFQVDAVLCAANIALRAGDRHAVDKVCRSIEVLVSPQAVPARSARG